MILRIIGGVLVCLSCGLLGLYMGNRGVRRAEILTEFKRTLLLLKSEIEYAVHPLPQAFLSISRRAAWPFGDFYARAGEELAAGSLILDEAWEAGLAALTGSQMTREDLAVIDGLGKALGSIDVDVQLAAIDMAISAVDDMVGRLNVENTKNVRMYRGLGVLSGLLIVVVLL